MRRPTDLYAAFQWWRDALAGKRPVITTEPEPGFYRRRLVKGGPWVGVAIWIEQEIGDEGDLLTDETLACARDGLTADPDEEWSYCAGNPITEEEYRYLCDRSKWAASYAPETPEARPTKSINLGELPPIF